MDVPISYCTRCGKELNAATQASNFHEEEEAPEPGDIAICFGCYHIMVYDDNLQLRDFSEREVQEMEAFGEWDYYLHLRDNLAAAKNKAYCQIFSLN